jgi:hypothetical protein
VNFFTAKAVKSKVNDLLISELCTQCARCNLGQERSSMHAKVRCNYEILVAFGLVTWPVSVISQISGDLVVIVSIALLIVILYAGNSCSASVVNISFITNIHHNHDMVVTCVIFHHAVVLCLFLYRSKR